LTYLSVTPYVSGTVLGTKDITVKKKRMNNSLTSWKLHSSGKWKRKKGEEQREGK